MPESLASCLGLQGAVESGSAVSLGCRGMEEAWKWSGSDPGTARVAPSQMGRGIPLQSQDLQTCQLRSTCCPLLNAPQDMLAAERPGSKCHNACRGELSPLQR